MNKKMRRDEKAWRINRQQENKSDLKCVQVRLDAEVERSQGPFGGSLSSDLCGMRQLKQFSERERGQGRVLAENSGQT